MFRLTEFLRLGRGRHRVLFVCLGNSCRSQMAEAFARAGASDVLIATSAGLMPTMAVSGYTRRVMKERQISMDRQMPKSLDRMDFTRYDVVVNLSGRRLPRASGVTVLEWSVPDPVGHDLDSFRQARDLVEAQVVLLAEQLRTEAAARTRRRQLLPRARLAWRNLWAAVLLLLGIFAGTVQAGPVFRPPADSSFPLTLLFGKYLWERPDWQDDWDSRHDADGLFRHSYAFSLDPDDWNWESDFTSYAQGAWSNGFTGDLGHRRPPQTIESQHRGGFDPVGDYPEPAPLALIASGIALLMAARRYAVRSRTTASQSAPASQ